MCLPNYGLTQLHIHHFMLYFVVLCGTGSSKLFFFLPCFALLQTESMQVSPIVGASERLEKRRQQLKKLFLPISLFLIVLHLPAAFCSSFQLFSTLPKLASFCPLKDNCPSQTFQQFEFQLQGAFLLASRGTSTNKAPAPVQVLESPLCQGSSCKILYVNNSSIFPLFFQPL